TSLTPGTCVDTTSSASFRPPGVSASDNVRGGRDTPAKMWRFAAPNAQSTRTTRLPIVARKMPTLAATRLLPTPPLPPPIATTRGVRNPGSYRGRGREDQAMGPRDRARPACGDDPRERPRAHPRGSRRSCCEPADGDAGAPNRRRDLVELVGGDGPHVEP